MNPIIIAVAILILAPHNASAGVFDSKIEEAAMAGCWSMAQVLGFNNSRSNGIPGKWSDFKISAEEQSNSDTVIVTFTPKNFGANYLFGCITNRAGRGISIKLIGAQNGAPSRYCLDPVKNVLIPSVDRCF